MYRLTGIRLVFKGTSNNAELSDGPVYVDVPLNESQIKEVGNLISKLSQQPDSADGKKLRPIRFPVSGDMPDNINCPMCSTICHR